MLRLSALILLFQIALFLDTAQGGSSAYVYTQCDNNLNLTYASDGINYVRIPTTGNWHTMTSVILEDANAQSRIIFSCTDHSGDRGFIASVHYGGSIYSTTKPIGTSLFNIVSASVGDVWPLVYHTKTSSPWGLSSANIPDDAYWVWNEYGDNTVIFEFAFCYPQNDCNYGYMDATNGHSFYWGCGSECDGGKYLTDVECKCACIPNDSCTDPPTTTTASPTTPRPTSALAENPNRKGVIVTHRPTTAGEAPVPNDQFDDASPSKSNTWRVMGVSAGLLAFALFL